MNNKLMLVAAFLSGAAVGSVVTWKLVKTKYAQIAQEEIDSVKKVFSRRNNEKKEEKKVESEEKPDLTEYAKKLNEEGYTDYTDVDNTEKGDTNSMVGPYVIPPDEFGEKLGYETVSLTYYADGILTDEIDEPMDKIDGIVGKDFATHFGEWEDDSVFIRNDDLKLDFEILMDCRKYSDIKKHSQHTASE